MAPMLTKEDIKKLVKDLRFPQYEHGGTASPRLGYSAKKSMTSAADLIEELVKELEAIETCS